MMEISTSYNKKGNPARTQWCPWSPEKNFEKLCTFLYTLKFTSKLFMLYFFQRM